MPAKVFSKMDAVIIRVRDLEAAKKRYAEKLGVRELFSDKTEKLVVTSVGGDTNLTLWELKPGEELAPKNMAGSFPILTTADVKHLHRILSERGIETGKVQSSGSLIWFSLFDLDGNRIDVCEFYS